MTTTLLKQAAKLPLSDRIKLVEDIWDSIADEPDPFPLTEEQKCELDKRLARMEKIPNAPCLGRKPGGGFWSGTHR